MSTVFRFNSETWCIVFCLAGSRDVRMWSNGNDQQRAERFAKRIRDDGGHVFRVCKAGVLVAALELIKDKET